MARQPSAQLVPPKSGSDRIAAELKELQHQAAGGVAAGAVNSPPTLRRDVQAETLTYLNFHNRCDQTQGRSKQINRSYDDSGIVMPVVGSC